MFPDTRCLVGVPDYLRKSARFPDSAGAGERGLGAGGRTSLSTTLLVPAHMLAGACKLTLAVGVVCLVVNRR